MHQGCLAFDRRKAFVLDLHGYLQPCGPRLRLQKTKQSLKACFAGVHGTFSSATHPPQLATSVMDLLPWAGLPLE